MREDDLEDGDDGGDLRAWGGFAEQQELRLVAQIIM